MAHLRKSVNMYFKKMNANVGKYADQVCLRVWQCMLMILKQRKLKFKPGIERKDYAFEVTILIIENIRKILWPCNPTTPQPPPYSLQSMGK